MEAVLSHESGHQATIDNTSAEIFASGSIAEGACGIGAVVLAILGLVGVVPPLMAAIAVIVLGVGLLVEGGTIAARFSRLLAAIGENRLTLTELGGGMTIELLSGATGIVLGILALLGIVPIILTATAAIVYGGALLLSSVTTARISSLALTGTGMHERIRGLAREVVTAAVGAQVFIGIGAITLGILALVNVTPEVLILVGLLSVGASVLLSGAAVNGKLFSVSHS